MMLGWKSEKKRERRSSKRCRRREAKPMCVFFAPKVSLFTDLFFGEKVGKGGWWVVGLW